MDDRAPGPERGHIAHGRRIGAGLGVGVALARVARAARLPSVPYGGTSHQMSMLDVESIGHQRGAETLVRKGAHGTASCQSRLRLPPRRDAMRETVNLGACDTMRAVPLPVRAGAQPQRSGGAASASCRPLPLTVAQSKRDGAPGSRGPWPPDVARHMPLPAGALCRQDGVAAEGDDVDASPLLPPAPGRQQAAPWAPPAPDNTEWRYKGHQ
jgi:hypothetical protein